MSTDATPKVRPEGTGSPVAQTVQHFFAAAAKDEMTLARVQNARTADELAGIASSLGYHLAPADLDALADRVANRELSEAELVPLAGGLLTGACQISGAC